MELPPEVRMRSLALLLLIGSACLADAPSFDDQVAPILAAHCLDCHSGAEPKGKLDLSRRETAMRGGENGVAIAPGNAKESPLWERVSADEMPPKKPLGEKEKQVLHD